MSLEKCWPMHSTRLGGEENVKNHLLSGAVFDITIVPFLQSICYKEVSSVNMVPSVLFLGFIALLATSTSTVSWWLVVHDIISTSASTTEEECVHIVYSRISCPYTIYTNKLSLSRDLFDLLLLCECAWWWRVPSLGGAKLHVLWQTSDCQQVFDQTLCRLWWDFYNNRKTIMCLFFWYMMQFDTQEPMLSNGLGCGLGSLNFICCWLLIHMMYQKRDHLLIFFFQLNFSTDA